MTTTMAERVRLRLDAMKMNPFEAARRAGFERSFVNDLLIGRKKTVRGEGLLALANVLECTPEFLMGANEAPMSKVSATDKASLILAGVCEAGVWRNRDAMPKPQQVPLAPDPRFPAEGQQAFLVRGPGADRLRIEDGMIVATTPSESPSVGDPLVVRHIAENGFEELAIRVVELRGGRFSLVIPSSVLQPDPIALHARGVELVGVIHRAILLFGWAM